MNSCPELPREGHVILTQRRGMVYTPLALGIVGVYCISLCHKDVDEEVMNRFHVLLKNTELAGRNRHH